MEPAGVSRPCTWQMRPCSSAHGGGGGGGSAGYLYSQLWLPCRAVRVAGILQVSGNMLMKSWTASHGVFSVGPVELISACSTPGPMAARACAFSREKQGE